MAYYQVLIHGADFILNLDGKSNEKGGFYTTKIVRADNHEEAESKGIELIRSDKNLNDVSVHQEGNEPKLSVEELATISWSRYFRYKPGTGYVFYTGDDE
ncbi:hypothetical protein [Kangiella shandongensis]|uniref:hypothetical protein n=1 Tax=Kangiella shandongensis TaxID=2763258 RepID=UPI001CBBD14C|nr:hypothetical protein [Kangiella shandongensis]